MRKQTVNRKRRGKIGFFQTFSQQVLADLSLVSSQIVYDIKTFPVAHAIFFVLIAGMSIFLFEFVAPQSKAMYVPPSAPPAASSYTLSDIYNRLTTNSSTSAGDHPFSPSGSPDSSMYSLSEIYAAIPTIDQTKVASGTAYLGISGSLLPDGGTATSGQVLAGSTFYGAGQHDWVLQTGDMPSNGQIIITPSTDNLPISRGYHDGTGYVVGDPDLLPGNISFGINLFGVNGTMVANPLYGDIGDQSKVLTTASNPGSFNADNLTPENVRNGTTYGDGQVGTFSGELAYGDDDPSKVLTNAATAGTFDVTNLSNGVIARGIPWGAGLGSAGSLLGDTDSSKVLTTANFAGTFDVVNLSDDVIANGVTWGNHAGSAGKLFGDTSSTQVLTTAVYAGSYDASQLSPGTVKFGVTYGSGIAGEYPSETYTLPGSTGINDLVSDGSKITSSNGGIEWWRADGIRQGAILDFPSVSTVCSNATVNTDRGTLVPAADAIGVGNAYCGVSGALLANVFNGTRTTNSATWPGGAQQYGGVEDFNANGSGYGSGPPADRYDKNWTQCTAGNSYCGTGSAGAAYKDDSTGLVWSKTLNSATYALDDSNGTVSWLIANNCNESSGNSCTKKGSAKTGCEANAGWYLPHQKQLMQAYIDGSYGIIEPVGVTSGGARSYWSGTTLSSNLANGWIVNLSTGTAGGSAKTGANYVRCVR